MRTVTVVALLLLVVGGLNWLLVGLMQFDLVAELFGGMGEVISRIVYILVGIAAIWVLFQIPALIRSLSPLPVSSTRRP
jgi:uncharacterized membrane protein YuzA (DUF378 family)